VREKERDGREGIKERWSLRGGRGGRINPDGFAYAFMKI